MQLTIDGQHVASWEAEEPEDGRTAFMLLATLANHFMALGWTDAAKATFLQLWRDVAGKTPGLTLTIKKAEPPADAARGGA